MADVGILGTLRYEERYHSWIISLGSLTARLHILHNSRDQDSAHAVSVLVAMANGILAEQNMFYRIPEHVRASGVIEVVDSLERCFSQRANDTESTFFSLGYLYFIATFANLNPDLKDVYISMMRDGFSAVERQFHQFQIDKDRLWNTFIRRTPSEAGLGALLRELARPLVILLVLADPPGPAPLSLLQEKRHLEEVLRAAQFSQSFHIQDVPSCRVEDLQPALLRHKPKLIHFSGHGSHQGLCFEDQFGDARLIDAQALANLLRLAQKDGLEAAILNACHSETQAQPIADAIGTVIAMGGAITDHGATAFTRAFYSALGAGRSFDDAFGWGVAEAGLETNDIKPVLFRGTGYADATVQ